MLGLFAFFYGSLHFLTYFILDHSLVFAGLVGRRGEAAVHHRRLHRVRAAHPAGRDLHAGLDSATGRAALEPAAPARLRHGVVAALHYWWKVKLDTSSPALYAAIMAVLLGVRVWKTVLKRRAAPREARPVRVAPQV